MATATLRRSFIAFHLTLGLTLLVLSIRTALHALGPGAGLGDSHVVVLAILEAIGAALFLLPRTLAPEACSCCLQSAWPCLCISSQASSAVVFWCMRPGRGSSWSTGPGGPARAGYRMWLPSMCWKLPGAREPRGIALPGLMAGGTVGQFPVSFDAESCSQTH